MPTADVTRAGISSAVTSYPLPPNPPPPPPHTHTHTHTPRLICITYNNRCPARAARRVTPVQYTPLTVNSRRNSMPFLSVHYIRGLIVHPTRTRDSPTDASAARLETQFWTTVPLDYCEEDKLQSHLTTLWRRYTTDPLDYSVKKVWLWLLFITTSVSVSALAAVQNLRVQ